MIAKGFPQYRVFRQTIEKCRFVLPKENTMVASEKDLVDCYGV